MNPTMRMMMVALALLVALAQASSHSEAPGTAAIPNADITDFYMFMNPEAGRGDNVVFVMNVHPLQNAFGGPNYYSLSDKHFYELYIDNNGDGLEDITFQFLPGNELAGDNVTFTTVDPQDHLGDACPPLNLKKESKFARGGLALTINGQTVPVPLKFIGAINAGDNSKLNWLEHYSITKITGQRETGTTAKITNAQTGSARFVKPFDYAGTKTFGNAASYEAYAQQYMYNISIPGCIGGTRQGRIFVGQRRDSFSVNLGGIFDLINFVPVPGIAGAITDNDLNNDLRDLNIISFVLEMPKECVLSAGGNTFGAWTGTRQLLHLDNATAHLPTLQVSRLGNPLVNEVAIGLRDKALFNADVPRNDAANGFGLYVLYPSLPAIINILFKDAVNTALGTSIADLAPTTPRADLAAVFLTGVTGVNNIQTNSSVLVEYMRLNTSIPAVARASQNNMGVIGGDNAGYPNGRRLGDDVVDISLRVMMGKLCHLSLGLCNSSSAPVGNVDFLDGAPQNAMQFGEAFPFLNTPVPGSTGSTVSPASPLHSLVTLLF